jgi:hypothetical protein
MKRLILLLPMMMITLFACDQSTEIVSPGQENESVIASQAVTGNTAHAEIPNRFIVTLKPGINPGRVADDFSISADYVYRTVLNGFAGEISEAARNGLMRDHRVVRVEQDGVVTTMSAVQENATWGWTGLTRESCLWTELMFTPVRGQVYRCISSIPVLDIRTMSSRAGLYSVLTHLMTTGTAKIVTDTERMWPVRWVALSTGLPKMWTLLRYGYSIATDQALLAV